MSMWTAGTRPWKVWNPPFLGDEIDPPRASSPWSGHRDFAYDLIRWRQPQSIVELGTHFGCSLFAFLQALGDADHQADVHAVDTWKGDPHAGEYGEEVFDCLSRNLSALQARQSAPAARAILHRTTFSEVLEEFQDESIDLLHIDGFHSFEALKEDFETWLPRVAMNGLVLLHDISPDSGYGSADYYAEFIQSQYPGFSFRHNFGLGIVLPKGTDGWEFLLSDEFERWRDIYRFLASSRRGELIDRDLTRLVEEKDEGIRSQSQLIDERDGTIALLERLLDERDSSLRYAEETAAALKEQADRAEQRAEDAGTRAAEAEQYARQLEDSLALQMHVMGRTARRRVEAGFERMRNVRQ